MDGLLSLLSLFGEKDEVARDETGDVIVDTCYRSETGMFETGVSHPQYNSGKWIIVEEYETREQARAGHDKWLAVMTADELPDTLVDVSTAWAAGMLRELEPDLLTFHRNEKAE